MRVNQLAAESSADVSGTDQGLESNLLRIVFSEAPKRHTGPAIFIDRDGVVNCRRPGDYVLDWSQFVFTPGIRTALKQMTSLGLPMIVISNQAAVGKGLLDVEGLQEITLHMYQALAADGTFLTGVYYCTHRPDEDCSCRKPKPGLLHQAASDFNIDLSRSIFIGDSDTDVQAAKAVGCMPVLFGSGHCDPFSSSVQGTGVPGASTAEELFDVVVKGLQISEGRPVGEHASGQPDR
jgi:D-glycero-D-manno-heptose 1,7-bisphosphate phosphatase